MKISMELFCGTKSFSKVAKDFGILTFTIDNDAQHEPDLLKSILDIKQLPPNLDYVWASPPCTAFSVASIGTHWTGGKKAYLPKSEHAKFSLHLLEHTVKLIAQANPKRYYIENPRGVMRKVIDPLFKKYNITPIRHTVWYCTCGDKRAKPTDIWTNDNLWIPPPPCHNGNKSCHHEKAPRGSKTGTQGLKGHVERGSIPPLLFKKIFLDNGLKPTDTP